MKNEEYTKNQRKEEFERWNGYANALLIASTVLFAGTSIGAPSDERGLVTVSLLCGIVAIILTVGWFAQEYRFDWGGKPGFLRLASALVGAQGAFLGIALIAASI